jgi:hypothetical protein
MQKLYVPVNLNLNKLVANTSFDNPIHIDRLAYLIHMIYEKQELYSNSDGYVQLKAIYLRTVMRDAKPYREFLVKNGVIDCDYNYIVDKKCYGYKLLPPYSDVENKYISFNKPKIVERLKKWNANRIPKSIVHKHLYNFMSQITVDYNSAIEHIKKFKLIERNCAKISLDKIFDKEFFMYVDDFGNRIHTNITSLKSSLRKFLYFKGQKLVNIDIANSQPIFVLFLKTPHPLLPIRCALFRNPNPDVKLYRRFVEGGVFYDELMKSSGIDEDRSSFKRKVFTETFFGKRMNNIFVDQYPTIASVLMSVKKQDYRHVSMMMQRAESNLIINCVCKRIMYEYPSCFISTIHDSILTTKEGVPIVKKIMYEEFAKYDDLRPTLREEWY